MYCRECGAPNDDRAARCSQCGSALQMPSPGPPPHVPNYLVWAILTTIFCCQPFGIVAIVFSAISMGRRSSGDFDGAWEAAQTARTWCLVAFFLGLVPMLIWLLIVLFSIVAPIVAEGLH